MKNFRALCRLLAAPLAAIFFLTNLPLGVAQAGLVTTEQVVNHDATAADRARIAAFLARGDVRAQLETLGVDPAEATSRVAGMSDAEVKRIAGRLDTLPAGEGAAGAVIVAALALLLLLVILDLVGVTNVFPFIPAQNRPR